jgi:hypothetical protein
MWLVGHLTNSYRLFVARIFRHAKFKLLIYVSYILHIEN